MNFLGMIICFTGRFDGFVKKTAEASTEALVPWQEVAVASVRSRRKSITLCDREVPSSEAKCSEAQECDIKVLTETEFIGVQVSSFECVFDAADFRNMGASGIR
jgi:NAD-dependent DNA ligase